MENTKIEDLKSVIMSVALVVFVIVIGTIKPFNISLSSSLADNSASPGTYDVVVYGGSEAGVMAAVQARKAGASVAFVEPTDWIGGMSTAAGVTSMDGNDAVVGLETGLYKDFVNKVRAFYSSRGKALFTCYWGGGGNSICPEPSIARDQMAIMLQSSGPGSVTNYLNQRITSATKSGNRVVGITLSNGSQIQGKVFIDTSEYGDLIALAGAKYRAGNSTSDSLNQSACMQDETYTAVIKKYPSGVPANLKITAPPPGYDTDTMYCNLPATAPGITLVKDCFARYLSTSGTAYGANPYPINFADHNAYRGMPNRNETGSYDAGPVNYTRISKTGVNWANDYPTKVSDLSTTRVSNICNAKLRTIQLLYYMQTTLGEPNWSVADDEYSSLYTAANGCANIPASLKEIEKKMPVIPYLRESRRLVGVQTVTGSSLLAHAATRNSVALGNYGVDLHSCKSQSDLESWSGDSVSLLGRTLSPYQIPTGALIPESVDGLITGNGKLISSSRLANGSVRNQPVSMLLGQAAGALGAEAALSNTQPRNVAFRKVQKILLDSGDKLVAFTDTPENHRYFKSMQLSALDGYMTGYGNGLFGTEDPILRRHLAIVITRMLNLPLDPAPTTPTFTDVPTTDPEFKYIEAIYKAGITNGCSASPRMFCPNSNVSKDQLAAFMMRTWQKLDPTKVYVTPPVASYADVPTTYGMYKEVESIKYYGIDISCSSSPLSYCPSVSAKRSEVAETVAKIMGL